jgi:hypothetical protein
VRIIEAAVLHHQGIAAQPAKSDAKDGGSGSSTEFDGPGSCGGGCIGIGWE